MPDVMSMTECEFEQWFAREWAETTQILKEIYEQYREGEDECT